MKDPEFIVLLGYRENDSDGFTYNYGKYKFNRKRSMCNSNKRWKRNDKRSIKNKALKRIMLELELEV